MEQQTFDQSKRSFLKKTAYVAPLALTLSAMPSLARNGSYNCNNGVGNGSDCLPPGLEQNGKIFLDNDDVYGTPGNPQNQGGAQ